MGEIRYDDIFELLSPELEQPADALRTAVHADVTRILSIVRTLEAAGFDESGLVLAAPVLDHGRGVPLVAQGACLTTQYVRSLLTRQLQDANSQFGPFQILPSDAVVGRYRTKVRSVLSSLSAAVAQTTDRRLGSFFAAAQLSGALAVAQECFQTLIDALLASPDNVVSLLRFTARSDRSPVAEGVSTSVVSMVVLSRYGGGGSSPDRDGLLDVGTGALLQDISETLATGEHSTSLHAAQSASMAEGLGVSPRVAEIIRQHHAMSDASGRPMFLNPGILSTEAKVLVATNAFLAQCGDASAGDPFEIAKTLFFLSDQRYLDERAVRALCGLLLPKVKAYVLEQAQRIASRCPQGVRPILWPVIGDKVPTVFLCDDSLCVHRSNQVSHIARPVVFTVGDRAVGSIAAGDYHTCPVLTGHLRSLYEAIQSHARPG